MAEGFHDVLFPLEVSLGARGGPVRRTDVVTTRSGGEVRRARWSRSRRRWDAGGGVKNASDAAEVIAFFEERQGRRYAFRFRDPFDHRSASGDDAPSPTDQIIGEGDGARTVFALRKSYGSVLRTIRLPRAESVTVAVDGQAVGAGAAFDPGLRAVVFDTPPPAGAAVTAGFLFDVPVRFLSDELVLEAAARGAGFPSVGLVEVAL